MMNLVRIYTKRQGQPPDLSDPVVLTKGRGGLTVRAAVTQIHRSLLDVNQWYKKILNKNQI